MKRVLYVVAREQPLLVGYLMTRAGARFPRRHLVEIKVDERKGERRLSREARAPERRSRERRRRPSLDRDLRAQGYATVVRSKASPSSTAEPTREPAMTWRPRSTWGQRASRRSRARWGLLVVLLAAVAAGIVVAWSIRWTPVPPPPAPQLEEAPPPPPASKAATIGPAALPPPSPSPSSSPGGRA